MNKTQSILLLATILLTSIQSIFSQTEPDEPPPDLLDKASVSQHLPPPMSNDRVEQYRVGRLYGYRLNDSVLIEAQYNYLDKPYSDFMIARKGKLKGVINGKGKTLLPFAYITLEKFEFESLQKSNAPGGAFRWLRVNRAGKYGLLDTAGREVVPLEWDHMTWTFGDTLMLFGTSGRQLLIGPSGRTLLESGYDDYAASMPFPAFKRSLVAMVQNGKTGLVDFQNHVILPFVFEKIDWVDGNLACVQYDQQYKGIIDLHGREILPFRFIRILKMDEKEKPLYSARVELPRGRQLVAKAWDAQNRFFFIDDSGGEYPASH